MQACIEALECPVCFKLPMPQDPKWKDCDHGHAVCSSCQALVKNPSRCTTCRDPTMMDIPDSIPRKKIVEALYTFHLFPCTLPSCTEALPGKDLDNHIKTCRHKIVKCPTPACNVFKSWPSFVAATDNPCYRVESAFTRMDGWDIVYTFEETLTQSGKTRILAATLEDVCDTSYCRAFVHYELTTNGDVCFYVTWADQRENAAVEDLQQRVLMSLSLYVPRGHYTEANVTRLNFWGDDYACGDQTRQLVISRDRFLAWHNQSMRQNECIKCPETNNYVPHMHLNVIFPKEMRA